MITAKEWKDAAKRYIRNTEDIRSFSSTRLDTIYGEKFYYDSLQKGFIRIRDIAVENRDLIDNVLTPGILNEGLLEPDMVDAIWEFITQLVDGANVLNLDVSLVVKAIERLVEDARAKKDIPNLFRFLDEELVVYFTLYNMNNRTKATRKLRDSYYEKGMAIANEVMEYLDKEKFLALDEASREIVIVTVRYMGCMMEAKDYDPEKCEKGVAILERAKEVSLDPFYVENVPDYDWEYHWIRMSEYGCTMTQVGNVKGLTKEQLETLCWYADKLEELVKKDKPGIILLSNVKILVARTRYYAGRITWEEYREILWSNYQLRNKNSYEIDDVYINMIIPVEYLIESRKQFLSTMEYDRISEIYTSVMRYIARVQNNTALSASLEYYSDFLHNFIEVPGGKTFYEVCLVSMAGMHLPTYVHSNMVGTISVCLTRHLLRHNPGAFLGVLGCKTLQEVQARGNEIQNYIYRAAQVHDVGKMFMIDTIFIYGRKLLDEEFEMIKRHPRAGADLLSQYESTKKYADMALLHHKRMDNFRDYPEEESLEDYENGFLAAIIGCADCMDAATDIVGRSYGKGITLDAYIQEVKEQSGTRYAKEMAEVFDYPGVYEDLQFLLDHERRELYFQSYDLMLRNFKGED